MNCNAKLYLGKQARTGYPIYQFNIRSEELYDDLLRLGVTPKKSRTLRFPQIPQPYIRHFIRGCWDGDGSVYFEKNGNPAASFITGSRMFAEAMIRQLVQLRMQPRTLHATANNGGFYFRYTGDAQCAELFHIFYDHVPDTMYLTRKYERFREMVGRHEGTHAVTRSALPVDESPASIEPIPVRDDGDYSQFVASSGNFAVKFDATNVLSNRVKSHFVFPKSFTRSVLAQMLHVSPRQVSTVMNSMPIVKSIQSLSGISDLSCKEFKDGLRKLKSQVNMFLYGWDDEGWDDLD